MSDDRIIELADSYIEEVMRVAGNRADVKSMLRIIALRAALVEVSSMHSGHPLNMKQLTGDKIL